MEVSRVLLDTSAYSAAFRGHAGVSEVLRTVDEIIIPVIVLGELRAGFLGGAHRAMNEKHLEAFLESPRSSVVDIGADTALRYAEIITFLRRLGTPVPTNDVWIAASAMELGAAVLTTDAHFRSIPQILAIVHSL
jgi:tRNA(fMet)-specific endonuclease VapC